MIPNYKAINDVVATAIQEEKNVFSAYDLGKAHAALGKKPENLQTPNTEAHKQYEKGYKTGMSLKGYNESLVEAIKVGDTINSMTSNDKIKVHTVDAANKMYVGKSATHGKDVAVPFHNASKLHESIELDEAEKKDPKPSAAPDEEGSDAQAAPKSKAIEFERTHVPSGKTQKFKFNKSHHWILGTGESEGETPEDDYSSEPEKARTKEAKKLVDTWNKISPDTWKYKLHAKSEIKESEELDEDFSDLESIQEADVAGKIADWQVELRNETRPEERAKIQKRINFLQNKSTKAAKLKESIVEGILRKVVDKMDLADKGTPYHKIAKEILKDTVDGAKENVKIPSGKDIKGGWEYLKHAAGAAKEGKLFYDTDKK
jgi:hypothetical protein